MKPVKLFEEFIQEATEAKDSKQVEALRKKLEGKPGAKTIIGMYKFYWEKEFQQYQGQELLKKLAYYDQAIRDDKTTDIAMRVGIHMGEIDQFNTGLAKQFIGKIKPGTPDFDNLWIVVQHADGDPKLQQAFLDLYGPAMKKQNPNKYNMLADRVAVNTGQATVGLSQGDTITYKGKTGWLPWQMKGIEPEGQPVDATTEDGEPVQLITWSADQDAEVNRAVKAQIGPEGLKKAKAAGIKVDLKAYIEHVMGTDYVGRWMIKR